MSNVMDSLSSSHGFALSDVLENSRYSLLAHLRVFMGMVGGYNNMTE